ncbi:carbohydrate ABC transporter permease [Blautia sp. MSJ-36]|uniref:carbohydrate ABC transporter permease n=1 Tax=Blautia sp. MSJ-36 TaxID=2841530 RepID=UPI002ED25043
MFRYMSEIIFFFQTFSFICNTFTVQKIIAFYMIQTKHGHLFSERRYEFPDCVKKFRSDYTGSYVRWSVYFFCGSIWNFTSQRKNLSEFISVFCIWTDRSISCSYDSNFCAFGILTFTGFLKNVPRELEEAAAIDGCGVFRIMTQIVFPLVKPATVTIGVLFFMWSWNDFLLPSILIGDSELRPLTVNLFMFRSATSTQWNLFIAGLTLCIIPTIVLYICAQKYITSGLTMGAVK